MNRPHFAGLLVGTLFLGVTLTLAVQHVRAAGIPQTNALTYSGYLAGVDGTPVNTPQAINLYAYNAAAGGSPLCQMVPGTPTSVNSGRFQILLPPECTEVVKQNPDLWIEVHVGGIPVGRTQLGAVPYAMESAHSKAADAAASAVSASSAAAATGALDNRIAAVEGFRGFSVRISSQTKAAGWVKLTPDVVEFDTVGGYKAADTAFYAPRAGYYRFSTLGFALTATTETDSRFGIGFSVNGNLNISADHGGGQLCTVDSPLPSTTRIIKLEANDKVEVHMFTTIPVKFTNSFRFQGEYLGQ